MGSRDAVILELNEKLRVFQRRKLMTALCKFLDEILQGIGQGLLILNPRYQFHKWNGLSKKCYRFEDDSKGVQKAKC